MVQRVEEVGFHEQLTNMFDTNFKGDKAIIAGFDFTFLVDTISQPHTCPTKVRNGLKT